MATTISSFPTCSRLHHVLTSSSGTGISNEFKVSPRFLWYETNPLCELQVTYMQLTSSRLFINDIRRFPGPLLIDVASFVFFLIFSGNKGMEFVFLHTGLPAMTRRGLKSPTSP